MKRRSARRRHPRSLRFEFLEPRQLLAGDVQIRFDYSYDSNQFFSGPNASRRAILENVASALTGRFEDQLSAITPNQYNHWNVTIAHPSTGNPLALPPDPVIAAGEIVIYVGAQDLPGDQRGEGRGILAATPSYTGPLTCSTPGCIDDLLQLQSEFVAFNESFLGRGQPGALATPATDFAPFMGTLTFDTNTQWYFGLDPAGFAAGQTIDFYTVASHELAHALGFGVSSSWQTLSQGNQFTGSHAKAVHPGSGNVPTDGAHWAQSVLNQVPTLMTPTLVFQAGQRQTFSELDFAAMKDLGWEVADALPLSLLLELSATEIGEDDDEGLEVTARRVHADTNGSLVIELTVSPEDQWLAPATITIASGQTAETISILPINDETAELTKTVTFTLSASGFESVSQSILLRDDEPPAFQNPVDRFDVVGGDGVKASDALWIVNELARRGGEQQIDPELEAVGAVRWDVNGDYRLSALDALIIINELPNRDSSGNPLGEPQPWAPPQQELRREDEDRLRDPWETVFGVLALLA